MTKLMIIFIGAKFTAMKKYIRFFALSLGLGIFMTACDSYHNVSADDGLYYNDREYQEAYRNEQSQNVTKTQNQSRQYIFEQAQNQNAQEENYAANDVQDNQARTYDNDSEYTTDPSDLTYSYNSDQKRRDDRDVHVYVHYNTYWSWYRPRWYFYSPGVYFSVTYYGGYYDPWFYDPWCDPWDYDYVVINNYYGPYPYYYGYYYYYGYPYYPYYYGYPHYYGYYGGYYTGYPYTMYNTYVTNVRGPRGGRPSHIGTVISRDLARKIHVRRAFRNGRDRSIIGRNIRNTGIRHGNVNVRNSGVRNGRNQNAGVRTVRGGRQGGVRDGRHVRTIRDTRNTRTLRETNRIRRGGTQRSTPTTRPNTRSGNHNGRSGSRSRVRNYHGYNYNNAASSMNNVRVVRSDRNIRSNRNTVIRSQTRLNNGNSVRHSGNRHSYTRHETNRTTRTVRSTRQNRVSPATSRSRVRAYTPSSTTSTRHYGTSRSSWGSSARTSRSFGTSRSWSGSRSSFGRSSGSRSLGSTGRHRR